MQKTETNLDSPTQGVSSTDEQTRVTPYNLMDGALNMVQEVLPAAILNEGLPTRRVSANKALSTALSMFKEALDAVNGDAWGEEIPWPPLKRRRSS